MIETKKGKKIYTEYEQGYMQGRADAIEECLKIVKFHENEWDGISWAVKELEQLKEKKND